MPLAPCHVPPNASTMSRPFRPRSSSLLEYMVIHTLRRESSTRPGPSPHGQTGGVTPCNRHANRSIGASKKTVETPPRQWHYEVGPQASILAGTCDYDFNRFLQGSAPPIGVCAHLCAPPCEAGFSGLDGRPRPWDYLTTAGSRPVMVEPLLLPSEAAAAMRISERTLRRMRALRIIRWVQISPRIWGLRPSDIADFYTRRAEGGDASGGFAPRSNRPSIGRHQTRLICFTALHGDPS